MGVESRSQNMERTFFTAGGGPLDLPDGAISNVPTCRSAAPLLSAHHTALSPGTAPLFAPPGYPKPALSVPRTCVQLISSSADSNTSRVGTALMRARSHSTYATHQIPKGQLRAPTPSLPAQRAQRWLHRREARHPGAAARLPSLAPATHLVKVEQ